MPDTLQSALDASPLFSGLTWNDLPFEEAFFPRGTELSDTYHGVPCVGLVARGAVAVCALKEGKNPSRLSTLSPGDSFGISNLLTEEALSTCLRAKSDTTVFFVPKEQVIARMRSDGPFAMKYALISNEKIQFLLRRINLITIPDFRRRVVTWISAQPEDNIRFPGTREELASYLGMSRAALFRELSRLESEGYIRTRGARIFVLRSLSPEANEINLKEG